MANFDNGVKAYITGKCIVEINFPIDWKNNTDVCCYQCEMFSRNTGVCQLTKKISEYPTKYIGSNCPLIFDGEIKEGVKNNEKNRKL